MFGATKPNVSMARKLKFKNIQFKILKGDFYMVNLLMSSMWKLGGFGKIGGLGKLGGLGFLGKLGLLGIFGIVAIIVIVLIILAIAAFFLFKFMNKPKKVN